MLLPVLPGVPGGGGLLATLLGTGLQVGSASNFSFILILFPFFSGGIVLLLVLHGLVGDVGGPKGPVGVVGLVGGGLGGGAGTSGAVSFLNFMLLSNFLLLSGSLSDGVPPDLGIGAELWLQLPDVVLGGLAGGVEAC